MSYWHYVLNEVTNKKKAASFLFTDKGRVLLNENESLEIKTKEKRDLRMYYLGDKYPDIYLTKREAQCMFWIVQNYTIVQTARHMDLSARTVEFYVKNLKLKLHCENKKMLIEKILETNLLKTLEKEGMRITRH